MWIAVGIVPAIAAMPSGTEKSLVRSPGSAPLYLSSEIIDLAKQRPGLFRHPALVRVHEAHQPPHVKRRSLKRNDAFLDHQMGHLESHAQRAFAQIQNGQFGFFDEAILIGIVAWEDHRQDVVYETGNADLAEGELCETTFPLGLETLEHLVERLFRAIIHDEAKLLQMRQRERTLIAARPPDIIWRRVSRASQRKKSHPDKHQHTDNDAGANTQGGQTHWISLMLSRQSWQFR